MPRDLSVRDRRRDAIVEILTGDEPVREQKDLVRRLAEMGFEVTQASVSRDLKDMGAVREEGCYQLPITTVVGDDFPALFHNLQAGRTIGPYQAVLDTKPGTAGLVAHIIENAGWSEVGAAMAVDGRVLVLTASERNQKVLFQRLKTFMFSESD